MTQCSKNGRVNHTLYFCKASGEKICWKLLLAKHKMFIKQSVADMFPCFRRSENSLMVFVYNIISKQNSTMKCKVIIFNNNN